MRFNTQYTMLSKSEMLSLVHLSLMGDMLHSDQLSVQTKMEVLGSPQNGFNMAAKLLCSLTIVIFHVSQLSLDSNAQCKGHENQTSQTAFVPCFIMTLSIVADITEQEGNHHNSTLTKNCKGNSVFVDRKDHFDYVEDKCLRSC